MIRNKRRILTPKTINIKSQLNFNTQKLTVQISETVFQNLHNQNHCWAFFPQKAKKPIMRYIGLSYWLIIKSFHKRILPFQIKIRVSFNDINNVLKWRVRCRGSCRCIQQISCFRVTVLAETFILSCNYFFMFAATESRLFKCTICQWSWGHWIKNGHYLCLKGKNKG